MTHLILNFIWQPIKSHYTEILSLSNINEINYSINITEEYNLSVRELRERLKKRISNIIKKRNKTQTTSI